MPKSRWEELYPRHKCAQCGLVHGTVPLLNAEQPMGPDQPHQAVKLAPFEILGMVDGSARPGIDTPFDTPAHVVGFLWGHPGDNRDIQYRSVHYLN